MVRLKCPLAPRDGDRLKHLPLISCFVAFLLVASAGCQQTVRSRLVGTWTGRPDTAADAAARSAKLKAKQRSEGGSGVDSPTEDAATAELGKTDLEQHDVAVCMTFADDKTVAMALGDGSEEVAGVWRVVATLPPDGAEIEISLTDSEGESSKRNEKRRFIIDFQENGDAPGFTLVEKGADPQFGRLYFVREDSGIKDQGSGS